MEVNGVTMASLNPVGIPRVIGTEKEKQPELAGVQPGESVRKEAVDSRDQMREAIEARQKLVLKPSEVTIEDRMKQVISADDMKRLLYMYSPYKMGGEREPEHADAGRLVDLKS